MEKKHSKKQSKKWVCEHKCPVTKYPCKHLEAKISVTNGTMSMEMHEEIATRDITEQALVDGEEYERQAKRLEYALHKLGLESFRSELLMDRFVSNLTLREIAESRGYLSMWKVQALIKDTLTKLSHLGLPTITALMKDYK